MIQMKKVSEAQVEAYKQTKEEKDKAAFSVIDTGI
eukprot:gene7361-20145_t